MYSKSDVKDRCVLKLFELNSTTSNNETNISQIQQSVKTNWPNSNSTNNTDQVKTIINEYYSPSVSMRHAPVVPSSSKNHHYQYSNPTSQIVMTTVPTVNNNQSANGPTTNHRSSSEPRFNPTPVLSNSHAYQTNLYNNNNNNNSNNTSFNNGYIQNPIHQKLSTYPINDFQEFTNSNKYIMTNNDNNNRVLAETYDNLSDHNPSKGSTSNSTRIVSASSSAALVSNTNHNQDQSKYHQLTNIYDKYSSMRIKSSPQTTLLKKERDIKSVDREIVTPFINNNNNTNTDSNNNNRINRRNSSMTQSSILNSSNIMMGLGAKQHRNLESHLRDLRSCERSGSITPKHIDEYNNNGDDDDNNNEQFDEQDNSITPNSISYHGCKRLNNNNNNNLLIDEKNLINSIDDSTSDNSENSKVKMKLMQDQLQKLTNLVHKALANKDLNQLAAQCDLQNMFDIDFNSKSSKKNQSSSSLIKTNKNLNELNNKTKLLRNDLSMIKKLHESFNSSFGDSMKTFANQLNDKVKSFCLNEINDKIKLDLVVYKYQVDSNKIENDLSDLEIVVDDLRENILKHKCNVNIDDVECYALALSQLSKQLVGLKTSFSNMKDHLKSSSVSFNNTSNHTNKQKPVYSYKYSENNK